MVISGHSHRPRSEWGGGVFYFNPGSAGPRRFKLPITIGRLRILSTASPSFTADIIELPSPPDRQALSRNAK
jgi:predicted phosphodiesterase